MSLLESITRGKENKPPRILLYGQEGVGKSCTAAQAPNPVFIQTEDGLDEINTAKFPLAKSLNDVLNALAALRDEQHDFRTVVLDSADWLERLIWDKVCQDFGVRSIEKADGGYGKGYVHALAYWRQIVSLLNDLRNVRGMIVIVDIEEHQAVPPSLRYVVTSRQRCRAAFRAASSVALAKEDRRNLL